MKVGRRGDLAVIMLGGVLAAACAVSAPRWQSYPGITATFLALCVAGGLWRHWRLRRWERFAARIAASDQSSIRFEGRNFGQAGQAVDVALALGWQPQWPAPHDKGPPVVLTLRPADGASPAIDVLAAFHRTWLIKIAPL